MLGGKCNLAFEAIVFKELIKLAIAVEQAVDGFLASNGRSHEMHLGRHEGGIALYAKEIERFGDHLWRHPTKCQQYAAGI